MGIIKLPIVINHDDLHRMIDEKIAELKTQYIPKADYENRLKADLKAILVELQLSIQELRGCSCSCSDGIVDDVEDLIDEKINSLKEK